MSKQPTPDQAEAFIEAASDGKTKFVKKYIDAGYDVNVKNKYGRTALTLAASTSSLETVKLLIDSGADVNAKDKYGRTALMKAAHYSNSTSSLETVKLLIDSGADVNAKDKYGDTAKDLCPMEECKALFDAAPVGKSKAGLPPVLSPKKPTPEQVEAFIDAAKYGIFDEVKKYIDAGYDVNAKDKKGWTALMWAAESSNDSSSLETVQLLIYSGADVNVQDKYGSTALMLAAQYSNESSSWETVQLLIESGANLNARDINGSTALMLAAQYSNNTSSLETVKLLLNSGANVNVQSNLGNTALIYAAQYSDSFSSLETVKLLIDSGTDVNMQNKYGKTAKDYCQTEECKALFDAAPVLKLSEIDRIKAESKRYIDQLSTKSKEVLADYTGEAFKGMNPCLRDPNPSGKCATELAELDRILANGPVNDEPIVLVRGFDASKAESKTLFKLLEALEVGDTFEERAFLSTSYAKPIFFVGPKCCIMTITIPPGVSMLAVESISKHAHEKEILLSPGMGLELTEKTIDPDGKTVYNLECKYCLPSQRFQSSLAPSHLINVGSRRISKDVAAEMCDIDHPERYTSKQLSQLCKAKGIKTKATKSTTLISKLMPEIKKSRMARMTRVQPPSRPLAGATRFVMFQGSMGDQERLRREITKFSGYLNTPHVVAVTSQGAVTGESLVKVDFPQFLLDDRLIDYVIDEEDDLTRALTEIDEFTEDTPIFIRGRIPDTTEIPDDFVEVFPSSADLKWFYNEKRTILVRGSWVYQGAMILDVHPAEEVAWLRPSVRKLPQLTPASARIYGTVGDPMRLEGVIGCKLFTESCMEKFKDYETKKLYSVDDKKLKRKLVLLMHHITKAFGKEVLFPALLTREAKKIPYLISGTTAINYWIQELGGGRAYKLPIIPTQDFDLKLDMKYGPKMQKIITEALVDKIPAIRARLERASDLPFEDLEFEWKSQQGGALLTLVAKLKIPAFTDAVGMEWFNFPLVDISTHTGISRVEDWHIRLPSGIYMATPEYVKKDVCNGWGQFHKADRRKAKMNYWNLIFPSGHRLHQPLPFDPHKCTK